MKSNRKIQLVVTIIFLLAFEIVFFRYAIEKDQLFGDLGDGRLNALFAEHWFRFFCGKESFSDLRIFEPIQGELGYSDIMFSFGIPFSVLRLFGLNMYMANKCVLIGFHVFGSLTLLYFLNKTLELNLVSCLIGVVVFSYSSVYQIMTAHTQLFSVSLVPFLLILIFGFIHNRDQTAKRRIYGFSCVFYSIFLLYSAFYTVFFLSLFLIIISLVSSIIFRRRNIYIIRSVINYIRNNKGEVIAYLSVFTMLTIPFFVIYLPTMIEFGKRPWEAVYEMLPTLSGFINVSNTSLVYGGLFPDSNPGENTCGIPLFTFLILLFVAFKYLVAYIQSGVQSGLWIDTSEKRKGYMLTSLSMSLLIVFLLLVRDENYSLWFFVYSFVPGASAIRAVSRIFQVLSLFIGILFANYVESILNTCKKKIDIKRIFVCALVPLLLIDNLSLFDSTMWTSNSQIAFLNECATPPSECRTMYILPDNENNPTYVYQLDAWELSNNYNLRTINGYSGQFPANWNLWDVYDKNYAFYVDQWCLEQGIDSGVYAYNKGTNSWIKHTVGGKIATYDNQSGIVLGDNAQSLGEEIVIMPDGFIYGPYAPLIAGKWRATIIGSNLGKANANLCCDFGKRQIEISEINSQDDLIIIEFHLSEPVSNFETVLSNHDLEGESITFDCLKLNLVE